MICTTPTTHQHNIAAIPSRPLTTNERRRLQSRYGYLLKNNTHVLKQNTAVHATVALHRNAAARRDPTRTTKLRQRYVKDMRKRFKTVQRIVRETLVDNDALRLKTNVAASQLSFEFTNDAERVAEFMAWLQEAIDAEILEVTGNAPGAGIPTDGWQKVYVREAYGRGIEAANASMLRQGITMPITPSMGSIFRLPVHQDTIQLLYTRQFEDLRGITRAMSSQISRELADGLATGKNNYQIYRAIAKKFKSIGVVRSEILVRTEIIRVHAESTLNQLEALGATEVTALVEFATAADPCQICDALSGNVYKIADARGIIPVHPNCRCTWLPVIG